MSRASATADGERRDSDRDTDYVQSLDRGLAVLRTFDAENPSLTLSEVARLTSLTRATARRLLMTFEKLGYMSSDGRRFSLTPKVLDLGYAYVSSMQVSDIAQPFMEALSERVHESVSASVLDGDEIVYVARVPTKRIMTIALSLGSRLPAAITSMGRVLLADLSPNQLELFLTQARPPMRTERTVVDPDRLREILGDVRRQGWALVDQELEDGVRSVAAPVRGRSGRAVAAINVSTHAGRVNLRELRNDFLPQLLAVCDDVSAQLRKR
jgi:IclR family pca regulon transcriptional regulator